MGQMETVVDSHGEAEGHVSHVASVGSLLGIFFTLLALTLITVLASYVDFGKANLIVALLIAVTKAVLVALFFMHLRYDRPINSLVFFFALIFLTIFIGGSLKDTVANQPVVIQGEAPKMVDAQKNELKPQTAEGVAPIKANNLGTPVPNGGGLK